MRVKNTENHYYSTEGHQLKSMMQRLMFYSSTGQEREELKAHIAYTTNDFSDQVRSIWFGESNGARAQKKTKANEGETDGFCGVHDNNAAQHLNHANTEKLSSVSHTSTDITFRPLAGNEGILELFMFNLYDVYQKHRDQTEPRTAGYINTVSLFYSQQAQTVNPFTPSLRIVLTGQKTFVDGNPFNVRSGCVSNECPSEFQPDEIDFPQLLLDFKSYVGTILSNNNNVNANFAAKGYPNFDSAHLYTELPFAGGVVGYAAVSALCSGADSSGINENSMNLPVFLSATIAHELGHNLGMSHDSNNNQCSSSGNIMAAVSDTSKVSTSTQFSSCSVGYFSTFYNQPSSTAVRQCLANVPAKVYGNGTACGNGFIDAGEQCDCGNPNDAKCLADPCCIATTCKYAPGASCSVSQGCCNKATCSPMPKDTVCRNSTGYCDLVERCDGSSGKCPADYYRSPGAQCTANSVSGTCALGKCVTPGTCPAQSTGCSISGPCYMGCTSNKGCSPFLQPRGTPCVKGGMSGFCDGSDCVDGKTFSGFDWNVGSEFKPQCNGNCSIIQTRPVDCFDLSNNAVVSDELCAGTKPATTQSCAAVVADGCGPDTAPPTFRNCPADFKKYTENTRLFVVWSEPTAEDNRGVISTTRNRVPGQFDIGEYDVIYTATDAAGLVGVCKFNFTVVFGVEPATTGTDEILFSIGGNDIKKSSIGYIAGGIGGGLVLVFITCYCCCGKRKKEVAGEAYRRPSSAPRKAAGSVAAPAGHSHRASQLPPAYNNNAPRLTVSRPTVEMQQNPVAGGGGAYNNNNSNYLGAPNSGGHRLSASSNGAPQTLQVNIHHAPSGSGSYNNNNVVGRSPAGSVYGHRPSAPSHSAVNFHAQ